MRSAAASEGTRQGKADLALAYHFDGPAPVKPTENLEWTPIMDDPMWIVLPRHHRLAHKHQLGLSELKNERWVQGCLKINEILESYARLAGIEIHVSCNTTDYTFAQALIAARVGIGLVPEVALVPGKDLVAIPLRQPHPSRYIGVVTRKRRPHPLVKELLKALT